MSALLDRFNSRVRWGSWDRSTATVANVHGPFAMTTRAHKAPRIHLIAEAILIWTDGEPGQLKVATKCGRNVVSARSFMWAPDEFALCDPCVFADETCSWVYRLLSPSGSPLYIGCTINLWNRITTHMSSAWWPLVGAIEFDEYPDHGLALQAEAREIAAEMPPFNRDRSGRAKRPPQWRKLIRHTKQMPVTQFLPTEARAA